MRSQPPASLQYLPEGSDIVREDGSPPRRLDGGRRKPAGARIRRHCRCTSARPPMNGLVKPRLVAQRVEAMSVAALRSIVLNASITFVIISNSRLKLTS